MSSASITDFDRFNQYWAFLKLKVFANEARFSALTDNASRIRFTFSLCDQLKYSHTSVPKNFEEAKRMTKNAFKLFSYGRISKALVVINEAITICPQDDLEGKKLYALLIAERSAVFFQDGEYEKVLQDVTFLKQYGNLSNPERSTLNGVKALEALRKSKVIELNDDGTVKLPQRGELTWCSGNSTYPALSNKVIIKTDNTLGRHVVAADDIKTGEIIAIEKPYAAVITSKTNCDCCAISTDLIHVCPKCTTVYCSVTCLQKAWAYHQYECLYANLPIQSDIRLALRMITQRSIQQVTEEETYAMEDRMVDIYKSNDYYNVSRLAQNKTENNMMELMDATVTAVILLGLLRTTEYFGPKATNCDLSEEEILVGELVIKYLDIVNCNGFKISEMRNTSNCANDTCRVAVGVYPTASLFNHACNPSALRYNIKDMIVIRSIKPIKAGDGVYLNYKDLYTDAPKYARIRELSEQYHFTCKCQACVEDWPLLRNMIYDVLPIICSCGAVIKYYTSVGNVTPAKCGTCKRLYRPFKMLKEMMHLDTKLEEAEDFFSGSRFEDAMKLFAACIDLRFKYLVPPFYALAENQDRLGQCFIMLGNKRFDYTFKWANCDCCKNN